MVDIHVKKRLLNQGRYLHLTNELAATAEVFKELAQQQMEGCVVLYSLKIYDIFLSASLLWRLLDRFRHCLKLLFKYRSEWKDSQSFQKCRLHSRYLLLHVCPLSRVNSTVVHTTTWLKKKGKLCMELYLLGNINHEGIPWWHQGH